MSKSAIDRLLRALPLADFEGMYAWPSYCKLPVRRNAQPRRGFLSVYKELDRCPKNYQLPFRSLTIISFYQFQVALPKLQKILKMKAVFVVLSALIAVAAAGFAPYHGHGHGYAHHVAAVPIVKVPVATSYQHEYRTYHPVVPVVKAVPVVKYVQPVVAAYPVHHVSYHGHGYGHGHGHGYGHY